MDTFGFVLYILYRSTSSEKAFHDEADLHLPFLFIDLKS